MGGEEAAVVTASKSTILRLDRDIWMALSFYLEAGDVARLSMLGQVLAANVRRGVVRLNLSWTWSGYTDFRPMLAAVSRHPHVRDLELRTHIPEALHWRHVDWKPLPSQLTSLKLCFASAITSLLHFHGLPKVLPNLKSLDIEEPCSEKMLAREVKLKWPLLPPLLTSLRLAAYPIAPKVFLEHMQCEWQPYNYSRCHVIDYELFATLPRDLKTLDLALPTQDTMNAQQRQMMHQRRQNPMYQREMTLFPSASGLLPPSLTFLRMNVSERTEFFLSRMPSSLQHLHLSSRHTLGLTHRDADPIEDWRRESELNMDDAVSHLPLLETLKFGEENDRRMDLNSAQLLALLPPSVTVTNIALAPEHSRFRGDLNVEACERVVEDEHFEPIFQSILPTFSDYTCGLATALDREIFIESIKLGYHLDYTMPYLEHLTMDEETQILPSNLKLPTTLKTLIAPIRLQSQLPNSLEKLVILKGVLPPQKKAQKTSNKGRRTKDHPKDNHHPASFSRSDSNSHASHLDNSFYLPFTLNYGLKHLTLPENLLLPMAIVSLLPETIEHIQGCFAEETLSFFFRLIQKSSDLAHQPSSATPNEIETSTATLTISPLSSATTASIPSLLANTPSSSAPSTPSTPSTIPTTPSTSSSTTSTPSIATRRFPSLKSVISTNITDPTFFATIPNQLEELTVELSGKSLSTAISAPRVLVGLQRSRIKRLEIQVSNFELGYLKPALMRLLQHLPLKLESLSVSSQCHLGEPWDVDFPTNLRQLTVKHRYPLMVPSAIPTPKEKCPLRLPASLQIISLPLHLIPQADMPPYLIHYEVTDSDGQKLAKQALDYFFSTRTGPVGRHLSNSAGPKPKK